MSSSRETINNEKNTDNTLVIPQKSPNSVSKRKLVELHVNEVKHVKVVEEKSEGLSLCCAFCSKKLKFISTFTCRCEKSFCTRHRFYDQHNCTFDYKNEFKNKLSQNNPKVAPKKI